MILKDTEHTYVHSYASSLSILLVFDYPKCGMTSKSQLLCQFNNQSALLCTFDIMVKCNASTMHYIQQYNYVNVLFVCSLSSVVLDCSWHSLPLYSSLSNALDFHVGLSHQNTLDPHKGLLYGDLFLLQSPSYQPNTIVTLQHTK